MSRSVREWKFKQGNWNIDRLTTFITCEPAIQISRGSEKRLLWSKLLRPSLPTTVIELTEWLSTNASVLSTMSCSPSCCCSRRWSEYGTAADLVEDKTPLLNIFWETAKWKVGQSRYLFWCLFSQQYPYWAYQARYTLMELSFMLSFWATFWFVQQQALCTFQCLDRSRSLLLTR